MSQSYSCVIVHLIFATKNRHPFIIDFVKNDLHRYMAAVACGEGAQVYEVGGIEDHVHILLALPRITSISTLIEKIKSSSSKWIKSKRADLGTFAWQPGYGIFSVSYSNLDTVRQYIQNQEAHHKRFKFQEELKTLLLKHQIVPVGDEGA